MLVFESSEPISSGSFIDGFGVGSAWNAPVSPDPSSGGSMFDSFSADFGALRDFVFSTFTQIYDVVSSNPLLVMAFVIVLLGLMLGMFRRFFKGNGALRHNL